MESPQFKKCTLDDWKVIQEIGALTFRNAFGAQNRREDMDAYISEAFSMEQIQAELDNPDTTFFLIKSGELTIGYLKLNVASAQNEPIENGLEIERIYVLNAYQGLGIGQLMLNKGIEIAKKLSKLKVWLGVWEKNEGAIRFYQRNGFKEFARHQFLLGQDEQTDLLMEINLRNEDSWK